MKEGSKGIISVIAIVLSVIAIGLSIFGLVTGGTSGAAESGDIQYVMYVGTNDKDTNEPYGTNDEVKKKVDEVLSKHVEGFTIQEANGGWTDESGVVFHEYTVVVYLSDTTLDKVHAVADDMISEFNQSSILIQTNRTVTEFYEGK